MNDKPVLTFTMPKVGRGAPSYPQVGGAVPAALLTGDTQVLIGGELKGTVTATVDTIKAAVLAGAPAAAVAKMLDTHKADIEEVAVNGQVCPECGIGFIRSRRGQMFCSDRCSGRRRVRLFKQKRRTETAQNPPKTAQNSA